MRKQLITPILVLIGVLLIGFLGRYFILQRAGVATLKNDQIAATVEDSLKSSAVGSYTPIAGKDYTVKSVKYFDNKQWVVVSILPVGTSSDPAKLVLKQQNGEYRTVVGPSNFFPPDNLVSFPSDVVNYLDAK